MKIKYNTNRSELFMPEYGRHIQKMIDYCTNIEDREERNKVAKIIIDVMGQLNPHLRDVPDFKHKLWDHLYIISDFKIDIDSPYPVPSPETLNVKPEKMAYPKNKIKFKHYGRNIEKLVEEAKKLENPEDKKACLGIVANLLKQQYLHWNRDSVNDELIFRDMEKIAGTKLEYEENFKLDLTADILGRNKPSTTKQRKNTKPHHRYRK